MRSLAWSSLSMTSTQQQCHAKPQKRKYLSRYGWTLNHKGIKFKRQYLWVLHSRITYSGFKIRIYSSGTAPHARRFGGARWPTLQRPARRRDCLRCVTQELFMDNCLGSIKCQYIKARLYLPYRLCCWLQFSSFQRRLAESCCKESNICSPGWYGVNPIKY